jgi:hypothetical protein
VPFIRTKRINGIEYRYLVECIRVNGRVRQRILCYLGKFTTVQDAHDHWLQQSKIAGRKRHATQMVKKLALYLEQ